MKKLKEKQLGPWCSYCPPKFRRAVWRKSGLATLYACDQHAATLKDFELREDESCRHPSEADYELSRRYGI